MEEASCNRPWFRPKEHSAGKETRHSRDAVIHSGHDGCWHPHVTEPSRNGGRRIVQHGCIHWIIRVRVPSPELHIVISCDTRSCAVDYHNLAGGEKNSVDEYWFSEIVSNRCRASLGPSGADALTSRVRHGLYTPAL